MAAPRVLVVLDTAGAWSRGILLGFAAVAHEQGWTLVHYHPNADLRWLLAHWRPDAMVCDPWFAGSWSAQLRERVSVVVNGDGTLEGVASVCLNEARIAELALEHLLARGFQNLSVFRFTDSGFAVQRDKYFSEGALRARALLQPGWWQDAATPPRRQEQPAAIAAWLAGLPKPCGVFTCCDSWARVVSRYARAIGLRVPEDLALVGVDNDLVECQVMAPPLTSVAVPWRSVGESAARLVLLGLNGTPIASERVLVEPVDVIIRRSSATFAIQDELVAKAVAWIHAHADKRLSVPVVAKAAGAPRQRLERHFRSALGRTVLEEIRRAHVEIARRLLLTTELSLLEVAKRSGFTNAALLSVSFRRELGIPPGAYRRNARGLLTSDDDDSEVAAAAT